MTWKLARSKPGRGRAEMQGSSVPLGRNHVSPSGAPSHRRALRIVLTSPPPLRHPWVSNWCISPNLVQWRNKHLSKLSFKGELFFNKIIVKDIFTVYQTANINMQAHVCSVYGVDVSSACLNTERHKSINHKHTLTSSGNCTAARFLLQY